MSENRLNKIVNQLRRECAPINTESCNNEFIVRELVESDFDKAFISLLSQLTKTGGITREMYLKAFKDKSPKKMIFVIEDKGKIIASAAVIIDQKFTRNCQCVGHIEDVVTDLTYRGKGLGKTIIQACINYCKKVNCYKVILDCEAKNIPFYNKCGFKINGMYYI